MVKKPQFRKEFKYTKIFKTVVKTIKQMPIEIYEILKLFYYGLRISLTVVFYKYKFRY